jgi:hypothetical protein
MSLERKSDNMQASIEITRSGSVDIHLDQEAARTVFASLLFAARFHEGIAPLARIAEEGMRDVEQNRT